MRITAPVLGIATFALLTAAPAHAQGVVNTPDQVISLSPILTVFKWFNVDYERRIAPSVTLGASGSYLPIGGGFDYGRGTFHSRYYPQGAALTGFYMGAQTGLHQVHGGRDSHTLVGAGVDLGYAWLLGPNHNHSVSIGFGATRMFAGDLDGASIAIPNVRLLNIGFAF